MANPVYKGISSGQYTGVLGHNITFPTASAGDLYVLVFAHKDTSITASLSGWTLHGTRETSSAGVDLKVSIYSKIAGGPSVPNVVNTSSITDSIFVCYSFGNATFGDISTGVTNSTGNPDPDQPPSPSTAYNFYQVAVAGLFGNAGLWSSWPSGYSLGQIERDAVGSSPFIALSSAIKQVSSVENPGTFGILFDEDYIAFTFTIISDDIVVTEYIDFIKDIYWNNSSLIKDSGNNFSEYDSRISDSLLSSSYLNIQTSGIGVGTEFNFVTEQPDTNYDYVIIEASVISGFTDDFVLTVEINEQEVYNKDFQTSGYFSLEDGVYVLRKDYTFVPNSTQKAVLKNNRHVLKSDPKEKASHDYCKITVFSNASGLDNHLIKNLIISYSGGYYSNSINGLSDDVYSFYPSSLDSNTLVNNSGTSYTDAEVVSGPTNSTSCDTTWISGLTTETLDFLYNGINKNRNYIDFNFNTSGVLPAGHTVNKAIFSIRYQNQSGLDDNYQDWCSIKVFNSNIDYNIAWGSGFGFVNSSFKRLETDLCFVNQFDQSREHAITDTFNEFTVRLYSHPPGTQISAAQLDLYVEPSDYVPFSLPAHVYYASACQTNPINSENDYSGKNRMRQQNFDEIFNISFQDLNPGDTITKNFLDNQALFWENYLTEKIVSNPYHNHHYKNSLFLDDDQYILESFNSSNNYTIMLHVSTSGDYGCGYNISCGAPLLTKMSNGQKEFELSILNDNYEFVSFDNNNSPKASFFDFSYHNVVLITKNERFGNDLLEVYVSDTESGFQKVYSRTGQLRNGDGELYIGGSGLDGFKGYIHEYGIADSYFSSGVVDDFYKSRYNIAEVLGMGSGLEWIMPPLNGDLEDNFTIGYYKTSELYPDLYQYNTPMTFYYGSWLTAPSAFIFNLDYENHTNNPSGIIISGYYQDTHNEDEIYLEFYKVLPSGSDSISFLPTNTFDGTVINNGNLEPVIRFFLFSPNNSGYVNDFKIHSFNVCFEGWWIPPTGTDSLDFITIGMTTLEDNFDLYLKSQFNSGELDFYTVGNNTYYDYIGFTTNAAYHINSGLDLYIVGDQVQYNNLDFLVQAPIPIPPPPDPGPSGDPDPTPSGDDLVYLPLFIEGTTPIESSGNFNLFTHSTSESGVFDYTELYLNSELDPDNSINLFIGLGEEELDDGINLFIGGDITEYKQFNMYVKNLNSGVDYGLDYTMFGAYFDSVSGFNLFIKNGISWRPPK